MRYRIAPLIGLLMLAVLTQRCASDQAQENNNSANAPEEDGTPSFSPYLIADSSDIVTYSNGLKVYLVQDGPGEFARDGMNIRMNYHGMLESGIVFDSSFQRDEPFFFTLGQTPIIAGLYQAVQKLRLGSKAIVIVPPHLGYSNREDRPPNIPENSTLLFHIDLLGSF
jgi:peptidylprolyl isomerase